MNGTLFADSPGTLLAGAAFTAALGFACVSDVHRRRIPNVVVAVLAVAGLGYSILTAASAARGILFSLGGLVLGLTLWIPFYAVKWLGAGDVKLFAAAGSWLGPTRAIEGAFVAAFAGGILAVVWMLRAYGAAGTAATASLAMASPRTVVNHPVDVKSRRAIPYGVALAIGAMTAAWFPDVLTRMIHATP